jgi:hypothetical protein
LIDDEEGNPKGDSCNEVVGRKFHIYDREKRVDTVGEVPNRDF